VHGGDERARTADPLLAKQVLSQLSYIPVHGLQAMLQRSDGSYAVSLRMRHRDCSQLEPREVAPDLEA
jgi:hypothetical protein